MDTQDARAALTKAGHQLVTGLNRVLKPTGLVIVNRTDWVEAMLDRRFRDVPVEEDRRQQ